MAKKDNDILLECIGGLKSLIRHRKGIKVFGKEFKQFKVFGKTVHIDHEIPGIILDTFDNLGFITKDNRKPQIINKQRTDYGWRLMIKLPPGHSFKQIVQKQHYFSNSTNAYIDLQWVNGNVYMEIMTEELPKTVTFNWDPRPFMDSMILPWPVGLTHGNQPYVIDIAKQPHILGGGATGFGKSSSVYTLAMSMLFLQQHESERVRLVIADLKGLDFYLLNNHALVLEDLPTLVKFMLWLEKEHQRRKQIVRDHRCKNIYRAKKKNPNIVAPSIVFIIDEFAEIGDKNILAMINHAVRIYRASGIHLVLATQRPSIVGGVMDGDTRGQLPCRVSFKTSCEADSRMILGEQYSEAAWLPNDVPGRAFIRSGVDLKMIQSMFIDEELEEKLLTQLDRGLNYEPWDFSTKRLKPH